MSEAVPPTPIFRTCKALKDVKSDVEENIKKKDGKIAELAEDDRYIQFVELVEERIRALETMQNLIDPKDTVESVGFRFLAVSVAVSQLREMISVPAALLESFKANGK